jgi:glycosyltransferase involved in cell wall biosynthesis
MIRKITVGQYIDAYFPVIDGVVMTVNNYERWINAKYGYCYVATTSAPGYYDTLDSNVYRYFSVPLVNRAPYRLGLPAFDYEFYRHERRLNAEIVHAHSPFTAGQAALRCARMQGIPLVTTFHSKYYDDFLAATKSATISKQLVKLVVSFYNRADAVWAVNHGTADTLRSYGYSGEITVMPNGVDLSMPDDADALRRATMQKYGITDETPVFIFVGQQVFQKNTRMLLEALGKYKHSGASFKLLMVGSGINKDELEAIAREQGIGNDVIFTGIIRDKRELSGCYLAAQLMLFPSIYDNAPLVVREAAALGRASVLVEGSNAAEGVSDCLNGYLCKNSADSLFETIRGAVADKDKLRLIGENARRTIPVSWERIVDRAVGEYESIIENYYRGASAKRHRYKYRTGR